MNILENNKNIIMTLISTYPNLEGLSITGNELTCNGKSVNIDNFDINDLLTSSSEFSSAIDALEAEDVFRIIRLHAIFLESQMPKKEENNNEQVIEVVKQLNPLMANISLISRERNGLKEEMLNIVDSNKQDHLFYIDRDFDLFNLYTDIAARYGRKDITPEEFIVEVKRRLPEIRLDSATNIMDKSETSEDFKNKLDIQDDKYAGEKNVSVSGNEEFDVVVVGNNNDGHEVVTYEKDEYGDLISQSHSQNINATTTNTTTNGSVTSSVDENSITSNAITESTNATPDDEQEVEENTEQKREAELITFDKFKENINSSVQFDDKTKKDIELFYSYMGELMLYENYLMEELRNLLQQFREFVEQLQIEQSEVMLNEHQDEAIKKYEELSYQATHNNDKDMSLVNEDVKKLKLIYDNSNKNAAFISTSNIIVTIIFWTFVITMISAVIIFFS